MGGLNHTPAKIRKENGALLSLSPVNGQDKVGAARFGICFNLMAIVGHGEMNVAIANLEMEAAVAVGRHALIWLSVAGNDYIYSAHRFSVALLDDARQFPIRGLEDNGFQSVRRAGASPLICASPRVCPLAETPITYSSPGGRHLSSKRPCASVIVWVWLNPNEARSFEMTSARSHRKPAYHGRLGQTCNRHGRFQSSHRGSSSPPSTLRSR